MKNMDSIRVVGQNGTKLLVVHKDDVSEIGTRLGIQSVLVDIEDKRISDKVFEVDAVIKQGGWEVVPEENNSALISTINRIFSDEDISAKLLKPLSK